MPNRPVAQPNKAHMTKYTCLIYKIYLSKLQTILVKKNNYICLNNKINLSREKIRKENATVGMDTPNGPVTGL